MSENKIYTLNTFFLKTDVVRTSNPVLPRECKLTPTPKAGSVTGLASLLSHLVADHEDLLYPD